MTAEVEPQLELTDNPGQNRFELFLDGTRIGLATYVVRDGAVVIPHTEIDPRFGGRGYGSRLVGLTLDEVRARGLKVVPACPFVGDFIRRHPDYADLL